MPVILLIIIGAAAGYIATRLMKLETNMVVTVSIGIVGALIGAFVLRVLMSLIGMAFGFIGAIAGALLLIWIWQTYFSNRK